MKKIAALAVALALGSTAAGASAPGRVVNDGVQTCTQTKLVTWYQYSNGHRQTHTQWFSRETQFIISVDPQGRVLPKKILVHSTPLVCVTDVF